MLATIWIFDALGENVQSANTFFFNWDIEMSLTINYRFKMYSVLIWVNMYLMNTYYMW